LGDNEPLDPRRSEHAPLPEAFIHIEETIQAIGRLHAEHNATATRLQRIVDAVTWFLSRPMVIVYLTLFVTVWIGANFMLVLLGHPSFDSIPYAKLDALVSLASLYFVAFILSTQRRDESLTRRRELLTLEMVILSEQKIAKAVALLEELRRDTPSIQNRVDEQADKMARPADPQSVIDAIQETRSQA